MKGWIVRVLGSRTRHLRLALLDQIVVSGGNFAVTAIIARQLGLEEFGQFGLVWAALILVGNVHWSLIVAPMMSIGSGRGTADGNIHLSASWVHHLVFVAAAGAFLTGACLVIAPLLPGATAYAMPIALATVSGLTADYARRFLFATGHPGAALALGIARTTMQTGVAALASAIGVADGAGALWILGLATLPAALAALPKLGRPRPQPGVGALALRYWRSSRWLLASALLSWVSTNGNLFIISALIGPQAAGALRAGQVLAGAGGLLFQGLQNVVPVQASRVLAERGTVALEAYLRSTLIWTGLAAGAIAFALAAAPELWLRLAFGAAFASNGYVLVWIAPLVVLAALETPLSAGLRALEHTKPAFDAYAASAILTLTGVPMLIAAFGLPGALAGMVLARGVLTILMAGGLTSLRRLQPSESK